MDKILFENEELENNFKSSIEKRIKEIDENKLPDDKESTKLKLKKYKLLIEELKNIYNNLTMLQNDIKITQEKIDDSLRYEMFIKNNKFSKIDLLEILYIEIDNLLKNISKSILLLNKYYEGCNIDNIDYIYKNLDLWYQEISIYTNMYEKIDKKYKKCLKKGPNLIDKIKYRRRNK